MHPTASPSELLRSLQDLQKLIDERSSLELCLRSMVASGSGISLSVEASLPPLTPITLTAWHSSKDSDLRDLLSSTMSLLLAPTNSYLH